MSFSGSFSRVALPAPVIVIGQFWPSALIVAASMGVELAQVFVNPRVIKFFKCLQGQTSFGVFSIDDIWQQALVWPAIVIVSGSQSFYERVRTQLAGHSDVIWSFEQSLRSVSYRKWSQNLGIVARWCRSEGLTPVLFPHAAYGGATNAVHLVAFSPSLSDVWVHFSHPPNVQRSIRHSWECASRGHMTVCSDAPEVSAPPSPRVLTFNGDLRVEGLLSLRDTSAFVLGPSVFKPTLVIRRRLTPSELCRLFDLPLSMDDVLASARPHHSMPLPYEAAVSPTVLAFIFRHVWGYVGGSKEEAVPVSVPSDAVVVDKKADTTSDDATLESTDSWELDSVPLHEGEVLILMQPECEQMECEQWDEASDDDSLLPRRSKKSLDVNQPSVPFDWELLDDAATCCLDMESETASLTSFNSGTLTELSSYKSLESASIESDSISYASQATVVTTPSTKSVLADKQTLEAITKATIGLKAVKADDAEVPVCLWDTHVCRGDPSERQSQALTEFRKMGFRWFLRSLRKDCFYRLRRKFGVAWSFLPRRTPGGKLTPLGKEMQAMRHILWHARHTSWFEYHRGSKVHYFRFPTRYQRIARDGIPMNFETPGPSKMQRQPEFTDPDIKAKIKPKIDKVIKRRYLRKVSPELKLKSLIKYFGVPKGQDDIRIVYDGTASGLNESLWTPTFWLPGIDALVRSLDADSWMSDRDIGDMFLNFQMHESAWPFSGVDVGPILDDEDRASAERWYHWCRNAMGVSSSPHNSIKMALIAEEVILGDRFDKHNPFQWCKIELNLPGSVRYDPSLSWVVKVRKDGLNACVLFTFVDDERTTGATRELAWQASHRLAQIQAYLGIQDAARKVGPCLQQPRSWAGAVVHVRPGEGVFVLTSEEKWLKLKDIVAKWLEVLESGSTELDHRELLSDRGFLVYVTRAYPAMIPYVKGFHLTAEMWRGNRDEEGWKLPTTAKRDTVEVEDEDDAAIDHRVRKAQAQALRAPPDGKTTPAPRLIDDLKALQQLTQAAVPPLRLARSKKVVHVFYGFGDASGKGRGSTFQGYKTAHHKSGTFGPSTEGVFRVGVWDSDEETESSNYREFTNLVEDTEAEAESGRLQQTELFLFTDNSTAESAFYKGSSSSKKLHSLVLRLHLLSLKYQVIIHMIHVSGKRMIAQGTDGCSRGVLMEGVMAGKDMLSFIDLDKCAFTRCPRLLDWIRSWTMQQDLKPLTPEEWFVEGHGIIGGERDRHNVWMPKHESGGKLHLWAPAPAIADAMLEELLKARHKRTDTFHVICIPRLMSPRWRRLFHKVSDLHFVVPAGASFWPTNMYEPLWIGIVLPFASFRPWSLKRAPLMVDLARQLCEVCKERDADARDILRKLLKLPRRLASVSPDVARGVLHMPRQGTVPDGSAEG